MIQQSLFLHGSALVPGSEVPAGFPHRARGDFLTIHLDYNSHLSAFSMFKVCLVVSPNHQIKEYRISKLLCRRTIGKGGLHLPIEEVYIYAIPRFRTEHLFILYSDFLEEHIEYPELSSREIVFEFNSIFHDFDVIECGAQVWTNHASKGTMNLVRTKCRTLMGSMSLKPRKRLKMTLNIGDFTYEVICEENLQGEKHTYCCWSWLFLCLDLISASLFLTFGQFKALDLLFCLITISASLLIPSTARLYQEDAFGIASV